MRRFNISIHIEPFGREVEMVIDACDSPEAAIMALKRLELEPEELVHSVHVGRPVIIDMQSPEGRLTG